VWERPRFPLDVSWHTIQAIENRHLPLSERIAHTIAARVGIKAAYLLRNELPDPLPDPAKIRERFKKMERYDIDGHYYTQLSSHLIHARWFVLQRAIIEELGWANSDNFLPFLAKRPLKASTKSEIESSPDESTMKRAQL
jgi:hypothetical protein